MQSSCSNDQKFFRRKGSEIGFVLVVRLNQEDSFDHRQRSGFMLYLIVEWVVVFPSAAFEQEGQVKMSVRILLVVRTKILLSFRTNKFFRKSNSKVALPPFILQQSFSLVPLAPWLLFEVGF